MALVLGTGVAGGLIWGADGAITLMGAGPETGEMHRLAKEYLVYRCMLFFVNVTGSTLTVGTPWMPLLTAQAHDCAVSAC